MIKCFVNLLKRTKFLVMSINNDANWYEDLLACPNCQTKLKENEHGLVCSFCEKVYNFEELGDGYKVINFIKKYE